MKFYSSISIIRVLAMFSIIVGHLLTMKGINHFQFGAIGVEIFLFISGYLYSKKKIDNVKAWMIGRWKRLILPFWITLGGVVLLKISINAEISFKSIVCYFLNLQGVNRIFRNLPLFEFKGMGQTWFLSVLMICYFLMIIIKKIPKTEIVIRKNAKVAFLCSVVLQIGLSYIGIQIIRPLCFFYGYFWPKESLNISHKKFTQLTLVMLLLTAIRFVAHGMCDGSILYDYIIFGWSFVALSIWIISFIQKILLPVEDKIEMLTQRKSWKFINLLSYPLFLTHYVFTSGELAVINWIHGPFMQIIGLVFFTCIFALLVQILSDRKKLISIL